MLDELLHLVLLGALQRHCEGLGLGAPVHARDRTSVLGPSGPALGVLGASTETGTEAPPP
ncbi:hypothetical protein GCM10010121_054960 [Streptomyces brasiliensis]|uniref:Uncharacterized protein n=1 Tax=Streptomyces brasiliensis TaxID=1954 RepID=A0A917KZ28_9ACTN|nr:hypothetical protein GCM10010121_054960 [Streptomyces brasiliensis]